MNAAEKNDFEKVQEMIKKDETLLTRYDIDGQLALHFAAKNGYIDMVKWLVEQKPGMVNFKNIRWRTPLHWATSYAGYEGYEACEEIAYYLAKMGGDINQRNKDNMSPLDFAKKSPVGKHFAVNLKAAAEGVPVRPVDIGAERVFWG